jgi:hypothetical protein
MGRTGWFWWTILEIVQAEEESWEENNLISNSLLLSQLLLVHFYGILCFDYISLSLEIGI